MVVRKLVKQGAATLMVSIPAKWAKEHNLDKGSEVEVEEQANNLKISYNNKERSNLIKIDVSGYSPLINRMLLAIYLKGYEEIEVNFSEAKEIKKFQKEAINQLLGLEIIKQSNNSMLLKQITGETQDIEQLVKRILSIIDGMFEELLIALKNKKELELIIEIDNSINKLVYFCQRTINKNSYKKQIDATQTYILLENLEKIGDLCKAFAKEAKNTQIDKKQIELLEDIKTLFNKFQKVFDNFTKDKIVDFANFYDKIKKDKRNKNLIDYYLSSILETVIQLNNYLLIIKATP
ncbi:MAG: AbrB/MazE/SpoVT family DNA-binding domain-containing protein [Candidatus Pacearchaeota archaeon]